MADKPALSAADTAVGLSEPSSAPPRLTSRLRALAMRAWIRGGLGSAEAEA
jgi:hypothetical protein